MPYPYTLMSDCHTLEPDYVPPKPPATTQEESEPDLPWYYSIFPAPVPESPDDGEGPPVQQTLVNRPPVATRPQPTSIPDDILDYEREQEKRLGLSPASQNDERSRSGSSQTKILADTNQANDESPVQEVLPDIAEGQDDFGANAVFDGISPERLHAFSNLEFLRVKQDIERRPLTFQHCFAHSASRQDAMECVYAYPPIFDESELRHLEQIAVGGPDTPAGMADGGTDDAHDTGFANSRSLMRYEDHLEEKYGLSIVWGEASDETNMAGQLNNLAKAISLIVSYLTNKVYEGDESKALDAFQEQFAQSEHGKLEVHLGANIRVGGAGKGRVPLPASSDKDWDKMFLGSAVNIATIVHEFGHVIDRAIGIASIFLDYHSAWYSDTGVGLNETIYELAIEGFAGKQFVNEEIWPDLFMTAVLDPSNPSIRKAYTVRSTTYERYKDYIGELVNKLVDQGYDKQAAELQVAGSFYKCEEHGDCTWRSVKWKDDRFGQAAKEHFPQLLSQFLAR